MGLHMRRRRALSGRPRQRLAAFMASVMATVSTLTRVTRRIRSITFSCSLAETADLCSSRCRGAFIHMA